MVSVVIVIVNIVFIILPNTRKKDHTFPGILEGSRDGPCDRGGATIF